MTGPSPEARAASAAIRSAAAGELRNLATGSYSLAELLTSAERSGSRVRIDRTTVQRLLRAVPGIGPDTIMRICRGADIDRATRIGDLSEERRRQLAVVAAQEADLTAYSGSGPRRRAAA